MVGKLKQEKAKVLIVDDHPVVRRGLTQLINQESDLCVCGEAEDGPQALRVFEQAAPDVAIVDISLKESSGIELIKDIRVRWPNMPVLVLSMHDEAFYAERALRAGGRGYITKDEAAEKVLWALRRLLKGEVYLSDRVTSRMLAKMVDGKRDGQVGSLESLSDRELEVFRMIGNGLPTREVAGRLHLSVKTIESYRESIKRKFKLKSAAELLQRAIRWVQSEQAPR